jgi:hypothetical protein
MQFPATEREHSSSFTALVGLFSFLLYLPRLDRHIQVKKVPSLVLVDPAGK